MPDEILTLSQASGRTDEPKISSGLSQSHMGDELFENYSMYIKNLLQDSSKYSNQYGGDLATKILLTASDRWVCGWGQSN